MHLQLLSIQLYHVQPFFLSSLTSLLHLELFTLFIHSIHGFPLYLIPLTSDFFLTNSSIVLHLFFPHARTITFPALFDHRTSSLLHFLISHLIHVWGLFNKDLTRIFPAETNETWEVSSVGRCRVPSCAWMNLFSARQIFIFHEMTKQLQQQYCIKFCQKHGNTQVGTIQEIQ